MPIQIVLDTNVLVAGLRSSRGASYRVLQLLGKGGFETNISVPLFVEYEEVLARHQDSLEFSYEDVGNFLNYLVRVANKREIFYLWRPQLPDPDDEMVLEIAVRAHCDYIVTFNLKDFSTSRQFGIEAIRPQEFLLRLRDTR